MGRDRRLVFTISTGRAGTRHLAFCLGLFRDVEARHEPHPKFSDVLRRALEEPGAAREFWTDRKLPRIARGRLPIYAETSHVVCKGFLESLLELGHRPHLIHVHRDPRSVALSLWRLDTVPGRTRRGIKYYLGPRDPGVLPLRWRAPRPPHDYQLCFWYCLEIERRARDLVARQHSLGIRVHDLPLSALAGFPDVLALGRSLELGPPRRLAALRFRARHKSHANSRGEKKLDRDLPPETLTELEQEVLEAVERP